MGVESKQMIEIGWADAVSLKGRWGTQMDKAFGRS